MDKLKMETPDMAAENVEKIAALFPSAVTEMRGEDGSIKKGVNFEMLKQLLSPDVVEEGDERYEFTWVGKKQAIAEAARPTNKTLRPVKEDSRNWDTTENLYIEGDNLEVLKILQESYLGKIKMIYIDPPYNTGHDFIYGKFAEALQTGLAESLADRPQKVDAQLFVGRTLVNANGEQVHVTQDLANAIYEDLIQNNYVKRGKLTDKYFADKEIGSFHVASEVSGYADSVVRILSGVYDAHTMAPENAHSNNVQAIVDEEKLHKAEFLNLWNRINHKSFYTVQFDTPELIDHSIRALDAKLNVTRVQINLEYGEQTARLESREQLEQGKGFQKNRSGRESAEYAPLGSVRYDLVGKLVEETGLTRATVAAILQGIAPQTFSQFRINPEEFILKAARLINDEKATQIIEHIAYNRLDAAYDQDIFTGATLRGKLGVNAMEANRSLYSHVIYDSDNERRFAQELDVSDQVAVYVKLPGSFYISTPVGKYNPDWAIAFNEGSVKHIYFVAETKGNLDTMELRGVENAKIECAKKHFAAISNGSVVYSVVDNYSTLMQLVSN